MEDATREPALLVCIPAGENFGPVMSPTRVTVERCSRDVPANFARESTRRQRARVMVRVTGFVIISEK